MPKVDPLFSSFEHDRDALHRGDDDWLASAWASARVLVVNDQHELPIEEGPNNPLLQWRDPSSVAEDAPKIFLGVLGDTPLFTTRGKRDIKAEYWAGLREVGAELDVADRGLAVEAVALWHWHDRHQRCAVCGVRRGDRTPAGGLVNAVPGVHRAALPAH